MPVQWDSVLVRGVADELQERLGGERLRSFFFDHGARSLSLFFRDATLVFRLHPSRGDVALGPAVEPVPGARPLPAVLAAVSVRPDDRILTLRFRRVRGRPPRVDLVVELMTNQWNALVVEADSAIVRHALWSRDAGSRPLRTGARYQEPTPSNREGAVDPLAEERWQELLGPVEGPERRRALLGSVAYSSALNAASLLAGGDLALGFRRWSELRGKARTSPCILQRPNGPQPYPHTLPDVASEPAAGLVDAFAVAGEALDRETDAGRSLLPSELVAALERAVGRADGRASELERQRDGAADADELRARGDLILARIGDVRSGATEVVLEGFDGQSVTVDLNPKLNPAENAQACYKEAARAERAAQRLPALIAEARQKAVTLTDLLRRVHSGEATAEDLAAVVPLPGGPEPRKGRPGPPLPYRTYTSSGGLEIRVGRGARWNDDLTFRHAAPNDVWLHARQVGGAHVVLRWSGEDNPPARDLEEAAVLAALNSKARTSGTVPVDWTRRKYVRKPRKAPPGSVMVERVKTVFVTPDPELEARLGRSDDAGATS